MRIKKTCVGQWFITEMELWDKEYIDLEVPGHLTIEKEGTSLLQFGAVEIDMDCRVESVNGLERLDFTFEGSDEGDPICSRGGPKSTGETCKAGFIFIGATVQPSRPSRSDLRYEAFVQVVFVLEAFRSAFGWPCRLAGKLPINSPLFPPLKNLWPIFLESLRAAEGG
ncbi:MAG: hypothetical protein AB1585_19810 [Thermodesulfobacteriota bacterium]